MEYKIIITKEAKYDEKEIEIINLSKEDEERLKRSKEQYKRGEVYDARKVLKKFEKKYGF